MIIIHKADICYLTFKNVMIGESKYEDSIKAYRKMNTPLGGWVK